MGYFDIPMGCLHTVNYSQNIFNYKVLIVKFMFILLQVEKQWTMEGKQSDFLVPANWKSGTVPTHYCPHCYQISKDAAACYWSQWNFLFNDLWTAAVWRAAERSALTHRPQQAAVRTEARAASTSSQRRAVIGRGGLEGAGGLLWCRQRGSSARWER